MEPKKFTYIVVLQHSDTDELVTLCYEGTFNEVVKKATKVIRSSSYFIREIKTA